MADKLNFLFHPGSGLGDSVVVLPVLHAVHEYFDGVADIDIITHQNIESVREIFYGIPFVGQVLPLTDGSEQALLEIYDGMIVGNEFVAVQIKDPAQPRLLEFTACVQEGLRRRQQFGIVNQVHTFLNNQLGHHAVLLGLDRRSLPLYSLGMTHYQETMPAMQLRPGALSILTQHGLAPHSYITLQDGWDANFPLSRPDARPTKSWFPESWAALVREIRVRHPDLKIVQLGSSKTGADIAGVDLNLRGKVSLRESLALLKYARLHVDTEGGLVHMARGLHTRSLVLFGPTNAKFFGYARNKNLVPPCHDCWWLTKDWMSDCVRGLAVPECMTSHAPAAVAAAVSDMLAENPVPRGEVAHGSPLAPPPAAAIGIANDAAHAEQLAAAGHQVTHFDLTAQKNIHRTVVGMDYRQFLAQPNNLAAENQTLDRLYFRANADAGEFTAELLEALRVLRPSGQAIIQTHAGGAAAALTQANLTPPTGAPTGTLVLTRKP